MMTAETIECTINSAKNMLTSKADCIADLSMGPSTWEIFSTLVNFGILIVAFCALLVANKQRKAGDKMMKKSLEQGETAHVELLNANEKALERQLDSAFKSTQAQLDASREATRADLDERKNSRELDITAALVSALDEMQMAIAINPEEESRAATITQASSRVMSAFSRFDLFVEQSSILRNLLTWLVQEQLEFVPNSLEDFEARDFMRIARVQSTLRLGIVEFQANREILPPVLILQATLNSGDLKLADSLLFMDENL